MRGADGLEQFAFLAQSPDGGGEDGEGAAFD
jgi:hypothetical protein